MSRPGDKDTPPNGITRTARYIITLTSAIGFGVLILAEFVFGQVSKPIPVWLYCLMAGISLFSSDRLYALLELYLNRATTLGGRNGGPNGRDRKQKDSEV